MSTITKGTVACLLLKKDQLSDISLYHDNAYMGYLIKAGYYDSYMMDDSN